MTRRLSGLLDCLRWTSALLVVITHTANLMVARYADTPAQYRSGALLVWTFLGGFGHQSVTAFYVLSGFLVGGPLWSAVQRDRRIPWVKYFIDRGVRIYLVLIPALGACYFFDRISYMMRPDIMQQFVSGHFGWHIFFGNLAALQNFFFPFFGSNGPIGTLAIEMWFYVSFPLFVTALCTRYPTWVRVALPGICLALNIALVRAQPAYFFGFVLWLLGAHARLYGKAFFARLQTPCLILFLMLLAIRITMRRDMANTLLTLFVADLALGAALHLVLVTCRKMPEVERSFLLWPGHRWLAGSAYSLYATHMPLLFLLTITCQRFLNFGVVSVVTNIWQWTLVVLTVATCFVFGIMFAWCTERRTTQLRNILLRSLDHPLVRSRHA